MNEYNLVQERVSKLNPDVVIGALPKFVLNLFSQQPSKMELSLSPIEKRLTDTLMPFQKEGVRFGIEKKGRCMIADEMGLGKTYQALALADFYKDNWPLLICTTASTRFFILALKISTFLNIELHCRDTWHTKIRELLPYVACHHVSCMTTAQNYVGDAKILITSYNLLERNSDKFLKKEFGFIIFVSGLPSIVVCMYFKILILKLHK